MILRDACCLVSPIAPKLPLTGASFLAVLVLCGLFSSVTRGQEEGQNSDVVAQASSADSVDGTPTESVSDKTAVADIGLDKRIDAAFKPYADKWEALVLTKIPLGGGKSAAIVLLLLVFGAGFFTLAFGFVNVRLIPFAIQVVSGKYDSVEHDERFDSKIKHVEVNEVDGDLVDTIRDESQTGEVSHFQALATAVSGTVGLGNIGGVAVAIATGGPGATFWMIICGFLGMSTKFVECTLGVKYRDIDVDGTVHGGPMYYLKKGLAELGMKPLGSVLAVIFAILCVGASFGGGNAFQSNQAAKQIISVVNVSGGSAGALVGLVMAVLVGLVIIGGIKRIASVTEKIVPFMAILYVGAALIIILVNIQHLGTALMEIVNGAFTPAAGLGGVLGVIMTGFQRAAFSNEAGAGSAAIAHSAVKTRYPASEGIVALLEPFIDTVVICTMTAVVIVLFNFDGKFEYGNVHDSNVQIAGQTYGGVDLTSAAFDSVLPGFRYILTVAIILFAFSTMISWSYYGLQSWKFLFGRSAAADLSYKIIFCLFVIVGAGASLEAVIKFSDAMILALVFPNMFGLLLLFPRVREELGRYLNATIKRNAD
ncbi:MAG: alanine:cation symporter family protein [Planctomycetales bacterium]|nr:alanine:cation symporter family protein [Planctomycetales bacterium]